MTTRLDVPFNIDILSMTPDIRAKMLPVTSQDTFVSATKQFNPNGLFSTQIFGVIGSPVRRQRFGYIDLRIPIIHPTLYKELLNVRSFYGEILARKEFAVWNDEKKDFDRSNALEGSTGFEFFMKHLPYIDFPNNETEKRQQAVALLQKYRSKIAMQYVTVIPAAYREYEIDETGRESISEINEYYQRLIAISNIINRSTLITSPEAYDAQRMSMQSAFNDLYELFSKMIEGKKSLLLGKFASRRVFDGTRNVITSNNEVVSKLHESGGLTLNHSLQGLYQTSVGLSPITLYRLKNGFLDRVFTTVGGPVKLCDPKTLSVTREVLKADSYVPWMSVEGLRKQLSYFREESMRHSPVMIEGKYIGLTYRGPDGTFALIHGREDLPEDRSIEDCTPITMTDLLYHALYPVVHKYFSLVTRYPITGVGSTYPCRLYLKTTIKSESRVELDPDTWQPYEDRPVAKEFPVLGSSFFNSLSPHPAYLGRLGADFDGDTMSSTMVYSNDACAEIEKYLKSKAAYLGTNGRFTIDVEVDTNKFVVSNMTGD